jgi:alkylation response protein AidB-like acyl-CoA dehydrogenase
MPTYTAPLDDIRFVLFDLLKADQLAELPGFADATQDVVEAVLEEAGKFAANELQPINHPGDEEGCHYENGTVTTPKGFKEAYAKFIEGGWPGLPCDPEFGGQGLPKVINFAVEEMICSANLSRRLVGHHVPDRAALRHRPRPHQDQGGAGPGR